MKRPKVIADTEREIMIAAMLQYIPVLAKGSGLSLYPFDRIASKIAIQPRPIGRKGAEPKNIEHTRAPIPKERAAPEKRLRENSYKKGFIFISLSAYLILCNDTIYAWIIQINVSLKLEGYGGFLIYFT